jgi:2-polyprenyl-3-methyl-5-hydroxy-6-metoxy-1,4-benzoquinol methylase
MNCFCGGQTEAFGDPVRWRNYDAKLARCLKCGHVRFYPVPTEEELASYYETEYRPPVRGRKDYLHELVLRDINVLRGQINAEGSYRIHAIHDYGCGDGMLLADLKKEWSERENVTFTGYEPCATKALQAREKSLWGVWSKPWLHARADLVTLIHVLEHVRNPVEALVHAAQNLRDDDALMVVRTPNAYFVRSPERFQNWSWCGYPWHLHYFTRSSLSMALKCAGLEAELVTCSEYGESPEEIEAAKQGFGRELVAQARRATR